MSKSKISKRTIAVTVWSGYQSDDGPQSRTVHAVTGPTVADIAAALVRSMKLTKALEQDVKFSVRHSFGQASCETRIHAVVRNGSGRMVRQALSPSIPSLSGVNAVNESLVAFLRYFTDRNVFTSTRDQVAFLLASRTAKEKREAGLVAAFNRLPARQQAALLKALRVGPAVVLRAGGVR